MKTACPGLILLAGLACAAGAENRKLLQAGFNPLESLINNNNTFEKIGKETIRELFLLCLKAPLCEYRYKEAN